MTDRPRRPRRRSSKAAPQTSVTPAPAGCWVLRNVSQPDAALRLLWRRLPDPTAIVTLGGRRIWMGLAGAEDDVMPGVGPRAEVAAQRLPGTAGTVELLVVAAKQDAPAPFCRELHVMAGTELLLRWHEPPTGIVRISGRLTMTAVWEVAQHLGAEYVWDGMPV